MWTPPTEIPEIKELVANIQGTVAGLEKEKRYLAVTLHRHLMASSHDRPYQPNNLLLIGPTGQGKTWMASQMLQHSGLPYIEVNATQYSEVGFRGNDLAWMFQGFFDKYVDKDQRQGDLKPLVERWGVVVLDEFDKWRLAPNAKSEDRQPMRLRQNEMLKIMEGDTVVARRSDNAQGVPFDTHHILFIAVGAFEGLDKQIGEHNGYLRAYPQDIAEYGFIQELVGRIPSILALPPLDAPAMARILKETVWPRWLQEAEDRGVVLEADEPVLTEVAQVAISKGIGARGFSTVLNRTLRDAWSRADRGDTIRLTIQGVQHPHGGAELIKRERVAV